MDSATDNRLPRLPPELINLILSALFESLLPRASLDPYLAVDRDASTGYSTGNVTPSINSRPSYSTGRRGSIAPVTLLSRPIDSSPAIFARLSLVNRTWYGEARKYLWRELHVGFPTTFAKLVATVGVQQEDSDDDEEEADSPGPRGRSLPSTPEIPGTASTSIRRESQTASPERSRGRSPSMRRKKDIDEPIWPVRQRSSSRARSRSESLDARRMRLNQKDTQQYTPPTSREASPARFLEVPNQSIEMVMQGLPTPPLVALEDDQITFEEEKRRHQSNPGLHTQMISFAAFRTHGMARTGAQGQHQRFVTATRLLNLLRSTRDLGSLLVNRTEREAILAKLLEPRSRAQSELFEDYSIGHLTAVGFSEYQDSAISAEVLLELLLRGGIEAEYEELQGATISCNVGTDVGLHATPLEALDMCGCVSARMIDAIQELIETYRLVTLQGHAGDQQTRRFTLLRTRFPHLKRLGMSHTLLRPALLEAFVVSFPNLTHLDLSHSRASASLLDALGRMPGMRLRSLNLASCKGLTSHSIERLLVGSGPDPTPDVVTAELVELSLHGDESTHSPLTAADLHRILTLAPCIRSGRLRVFDISSTAVTDAALLSMPDQPSLLDLGLAHCIWLTLDGVTDFLRGKASNVEILDVRGSFLGAPVNLLGARAGTMPVSNLGRTESPSRIPRTRPSLDVMALHSKLIFPLCQTLGTFTKEDDSRTYVRRVSHLRCVELDDTTLEDIQGGAFGFAVVNGRGKRGWYIDTSVTSIPSHIAEDTSRRSLVKLDSESDVTRALRFLSSSPGSASADIGWHAQKSSILRDAGLLGRDAGLYAFHAFQHRKARRLKRQQRARLDTFFTPLDATPHKEHYVTLALAGLASTSLAHTGSSHASGLEARELHRRAIKGPFSKLVASKKLTSKQKAAQQFCRDFTGTCYKTCFAGNYGKEVSIVFECQAAGNGYDFGCSCNGKDKTNTVLNKIGKAHLTPQTVLLTTSTDTVSSTATTTVTEGVLVNNTKPVTVDVTSTVTVPTTTVVKLTTVTDGTTITKEVTKTAITLPTVVSKLVAPAVLVKSSNTDNSLCLAFTDTCKSQCRYDGSLAGTLTCKKGSNGHYALKCKCLDGKDFTRQALAQVEHKSPHSTTIPVVGTTTVLQTQSVTVTKDYYTNVGPTVTDVHLKTVKKGATTTTTTVYAKATHTTTSTTIIAAAASGVVQLRTSSKKLGYISENYSTRMNGKKSSSPLPFYGTTTKRNSALEVFFAKVGNSSYYNLMSINGVDPRYPALGGIVPHGNSATFGPKKLGYAILSDVAPSSGEPSSAGNAYAVPSLSESAIWNVSTIGHTLAASWTNPGGKIKKTQALYDPKDDAIIIAGDYKTYHARYPGYGVPITLSFTPYLNSNSTK
ncbi:uncharacterized protein L969DRAFT_102433 [Mixia osmundae IAM 14324]|uniref:Uncharacterized protein n=1 Tax=Mixia osmundae (strain CBS 9802 / IAM 14324 / JCM 22182 / KY 12970) TaxID=764103 RepID=G7DU69_MIXOS|nr:uncharacterized protein L969DRAFT_102433 [Mixia osmundae IAM 14324]KEI40996.1 hypothetical protein L969DRAFT_102433 [Mixia osmundae IAM 14324]GAA94129.1 hypothetical protein E5Q_00777 [Mixia osmundae IAM 14324]